MKVLITTDNIGGVWTYTMNLARGLKRSGVDVFIAVIGNPVNEYEKKELEPFSWYFHAAKQEWMSDPWDDVAKTGRWLMKLKKIVHPDIIHLNSYSLGSLHWNVPVVITGHSCVLSWWEAVWGKEIPSELEQYRKNVTAGIQSADVIVAPSNAMMSAIEKFYKPAGRKKVIYNGGDNSLYYSDIKENYVFCMGRLWDEAKNIKLVLKAAPEIKYPIYIAGRIEKQESRNVPANVSFIGQVHPGEVTCWLAKAAIYLLPVIYEPFGYTFLEAAFSGCAIVTGNIDSMSEIWGDSAILADTRNSHALADTINRLMADRKERHRLGAMARERAMDRYRFDRMTSEYILLYRKMKDNTIRENLKLQEQ